MSDETFSFGTTLIICALLIVVIPIGMICYAIFYGVLGLIIALLYILDYITTAFVELINELTNYINVHSGELLIILAGLLLTGLCVFLLSKYKRY